MIRCLLIKENNDLDKRELADLGAARRKRIEDAARLEGITFQEALEKKRGFRYLY